MVCEAFELRNWEKNQRVNEDAALIDLRMSQPSSCSVFNTGREVLLY